MCDDKRKAWRVVLLLASALPSWPPASLPLSPGCCDQLSQEERKYFIRYFMKKGCLLFQFDQYQNLVRFRIDLICGNEEHQKCSCVISFLTLKLFECHLFLLYPDTSPYNTKWQGVPVLTRWVSSWGWAWQWLGWLSPPCLESTCWQESRYRLLHNDCWKIEGCTITA